VHGLDRSVDAVVITFRDITGAQAGGGGPTAGSRRSWRFRVQERTAELSRASELLEKVFSSTGVKIAYMDRDFNFIRVNRTYAEAERPAPGILRWQEPL